MQQYLRLFTTTPQYSQSYIAANKFCDFCVVCLVIMVVIAEGIHLINCYYQKHSPLIRESTSPIWEFTSTVSMAFVILITLPLAFAFVIGIGVKRPIKATSQQQAIQAINAVHREYPYLMHVSCTYNDDDYGLFQYGDVSRTSKYYLLKKKPQNATAKVYQLKITKNDNHTTAQLKYAGQCNLSVARNITIRDSRKYFVKKVLKHTYWLGNVYHQ